MAPKSNFHGTFVAPKQKKRHDRNYMTLAKILKKTTGWGI